ncbi:MAG TPA: SpaA isopeptide-forming pilin-related protein [Ruminococcus flavefaciens]|nr:SpaA isopeptide-forming pilin-related protein [Ruminococcus flavefaciens]HQM00632.1 SpaA isopeptide-forming pilin-related protein [Ruminococcus flavefaciens]
MTDKEYSVSYTQGEVESSVVGSDLQNIRKDTVTNTPVTKGVRIRLSEWNGTAADRDFKAALPDGTFTLKLNGDAVNFGEFTSDENGMVAILYDYEKGENNIYTLTQTDAPVTWVGTDTPIRFFIEEVDGTDHVRILNPENDGWVNHKDISSGDLIGDIIVYNKKLSLNMIKYAAGSNDPLARAEFDLFRGTKQPDGSYLQNYYPISGYEALVSGADGVIPKIDETLPPGRYFLREKRSPNGYEPFVDAIEFNISELGEVELVNAPIGVFLSSDTSQEGKVIVRIKAGNTRKDAQTANLIVIKKVEGAFGDRTKDFAFTLTVENSADEYFMWTLNEVTQESISSGDTFHLADGDTAVFILPLECEVTVTEAAEDYTASMQLNHAEVQNTDSITFAFSATTELLVTNIRNGVLSTGIPDTLCKALLLFIVPVPPIGMLLYSKRKRKRVT